MSYQVGSACYATLVDAGGAACSAYSPVSGLVENGAKLRTVSCTSSDASTGALNLQITTTAVDGSGSTTATVSQLISFPTCSQGDYLAAGEMIFGAILAVWAAVYGVNEVRKLLTWGRGDAS